MKKNTLIKLFPQTAQMLQDRQLKVSELAEILSHYEIEHELGKPYRPSRRFVRPSTKTVFVISWIKKPTEKLSAGLISRIRQRFGLTPKHGVTNEAFYSKLK